MNDLKRWQVSDDRLTEIIRGPASDAGAMATELRDLRVARAASAERVRGVVREAIARAYHYAEDNAEISEHDGWHRTAPTIEWPSASKAETELDDIAARAAEQLAGGGVAAYGTETALRGMTSAYDRVVREKHDLEAAASPPAVDYRAGIRTILASDMPGEAMRKALEELVGLR